MTRKTASHRVAIDGDFTIVNACAIREQLLAALDQADETEVDLSQVAEIDSAGLQLMIAAKRHATQLGKSLRFTDHSPAALDALDLTNLSAHFGDPVLIQSRG